MAGVISLATKSELSELVGEGGMFFSAAWEILSSLTEGEEVL